MPAFPKITCFLTLRKTIKHNNCQQNMTYSECPAVFYLIEVQITQKIQPTAFLCDSRYCSKSLTNSSLSGGVGNGPTSSYKKFQGNNLTPCCQKMCQSLSRLKSVAKTHLFKSAFLNCNNNTCTIILFLSHMVHMYIISIVVVSPSCWLYN